MDDTFELAGAGCGGVEEVREEADEAISQLAFAYSQGRFGVEDKTDCFFSPDVCEVLGDLVAGGDGTLRLGFFMGVQGDVFYGHVSVMGGYDVVFDLYHRQMTVSRYVGGGLGWAELGAAPVLGHLRAQRRLPLPARRLLRAQRHRHRRLPGRRRPTRRALPRPDALSSLTGFPSGRIGLPIQVDCCYDCFCGRNSAAWEPNRLKRLRIYTDTSVFGGCFDEDFEQDSLKLFDEISSGRFDVILSTTTMRELSQAPERVRQVVADIPPDRIEIQELSDEIEKLRDAYLKAGVVGPSSKLDAEHVACATVASADLIVSWNFKHIVHFDRIRAYHAVNLMEGYRPIPIHSPREVIET